MLKTRVKIHAKTWKVYSLPKLKFDAKYPAEAIAITQFDHSINLRHLVFRTGKVSLATIVHEVTHAYLSNVNLPRSSRQAEEVFCSFLERNIKKIMKTSKTVQRGLK